MGKSEIMQENRNKYTEDKELLTPSKVVYILLFMLGLWGCLAIFNATVYSTSPFYFTGRQLIWLLTGMVVIYVFSKIPFAVYKFIIFPMAICAYLPLWLVLDPHIGTKVNGMRGWFRFGNVFLQPSELAKAPFILFISWLVTSRRCDLKRYLLLLAITVLWLVPILLEPDYGTFMIYIAGFTVVYWSGGGKILYLIVTVFSGIPLAIYLMIRKGYIIERIQGFWNPAQDPTGAGWHIFQFRYTLARGGFWGADWGKSIWSNTYLPLSHSDSAFASLTEAVGFAGALPVILGFVFLTYVVYRLSVKIKDDCRKLFIFSMGTIVTIQALIHISVNVTIVPPTGITLPMISYGGSSLVSTFLAFGLILSAARDDENKPTVEKLGEKDEN